MDINEKRKVRLQALQNLREKTLDEAQKRRISTPDRSVNLASGELDKDVLRASGGSSGADMTPDTTRVKGTTEKIDNIKMAPISDIEEFAGDAKLRSLKGDLRSTFADAIKRGDDDMIRKLRRIAGKVGKEAGKGLKAVPVLGTLAAAALAPGDASAAIPILSEAGPVGATPEEEDIMLAEGQARKDYRKSEAHKNRLAALAKLAKSQE